MNQYIIEVLFRGIPEGLIFVYATYLFSKKKVKLKPYIMSSMLLGIATYSIRLLPIHIGINNILNIIVFIILTNKVNKIELTKSIKVVFASMFIGFICEGINVIIIQYLFKLDVNYVFSQANLKVLYGIPSLLIYGLIMIIATYFYNMKSRKKTSEIYYN